MAQQIVQKKYKVTLPRDIVEHIRGFSQPEQWWPTQFVVNRFYTRTCEKFLVSKGCKPRKKGGSILLNRNINRRVYMGSQAECERFDRYVIETLFNIKDTPSYDISESLYLQNALDQIDSPFVIYRPAYSYVGHDSPGMLAPAVSRNTPAIVIEYNGKKHRLIPIDRPSPFVFDTVESFHQQLGIVHLTRRQKGAKNGKVQGTYLKN